MPKVVDPVARRQQIFEALFGVVAKSGIAQASLRRVAGAAELAVGSVRHYFPSHEELVSAAAAELIERISGRLLRHRERLAGAADRLQVAEDMLCELLPLSEHAAREVTVWLEIVTAARVDSTLREPADRLLAGTRRLAATVVERLGESREKSAELEAQRLAAIIDGLALRCVLGQVTPDDARATVRLHLRSAVASGR